MESNWDPDDAWGSDTIVGSGSEIAVAGPEDVQDDEFETSDFDASSMSMFGSVSSSIYRHSYENGRRYHKYRYGTYPIPNDETEQNREDMKHVAILELTRYIMNYRANPYAPDPGADGYLRGKNYFAPIGDHPRKIIDLGTGTGTWAIEVAEMFPGAEVVGCDLSPIQPFWVPSNVRFIIDDIEDEWAHGDGWDLVHIRQVFPTTQDPPGVCRQSLRHLKPGGWIEVQDFGGILKCDDDTFQADSLLTQFYDMTAEALSKRGIRWTIANSMDEVLRQIGFVNIECKKFKVPIGIWPKAKRLRLVGLYMKSVFGDLIDALAPIVFPVLSKSPQQMREFVANAQEELQTTTAHIYLDYFFWYAQKPPAD
ncbi:S-adenosyl-L-methionine-dependent methyltransferase [Annulohypoxylon truncatum]|uniref:S-adenosyl-L-methionine-dependent methyltransferase n=1 Tax=Annulohypoxylon truncatum TaxID=327061 RepID=UPI002007E389|nr:S-adenosyl-L-methionine-dependent methyltransferase [Annulohypoxylon truncatum]KAI1206965.1 S-adenosyl-L-methionine-dependent methyltransferase [Annulohypoxylon truncatum]